MESFCQHVILFCEVRGVVYKGGRGSSPDATPTQCIQAIMLIAAGTQGGAHVNARIEAAIQRRRKR